MSALRGTALGTVALPTESERRGSSAEEAGNGSTGLLGGRAKRALNGDSDDEVGEWWAFWSKWAFG